ncbi:dihydrolipoamide acetyltransferase family protein [Siminovitchia sediminis]|uniref:Dihydrolipoamide acetyltransferase component of pyruvate dehydrogenase complex n=1 Tax=Siminovitchia sediminis TaxID=1274353 RepID=A0ABW4KLH8_9BACI
MPQLGESVTEGTISKWLVKPGDTVQKYDPLAEVITDKVNAEVPSSFTGTIQEIIVMEDETIEVGEAICTIETADSGDGPQTDSPASNGKRKDPSENQNQITEQQSQQTETGIKKARYSPAVVRLAQEHQIDLEQVEGSGREGRITRKDLLRLIDSGHLPKKTDAGREIKLDPSDAVFKPPIPSIPLPSSPGDIDIPITNIRKTIAANMVHSKHEIPHAWMMMEVDVTNLVQFRDSIKQEFKQKEGFNLTYFAFFVKAVAMALKEYPMMNSMWAGDKIVQKKEINLSIAVASKDVLYVPVIRHADELSIKGIAKKVSELAHKARSGKLTAEDVRGGTFTVNNTGSFGSVQSMGIINHPQAAILQVESIVKRPVVLSNGGIAARDMVNLCLSLDHRILDGLVCGHFLNRVKEILESVSKDHTSIY